MNLVQMSITAGILIIGITVFRTLFIHRVPKRVMVLLWEIAILRLILPFVVPLPFPGLGDIGGITIDSNRMEMVSVTVGDIAPGMLRQMTGQGPATEGSTDVVAVSAKVVSLDESYLLWGIYGAVAILMLLGSLYLYFRDSQFFREGLLMPEREKRFLLLGLEEKDRKRLEKITFRTSDRTASPVTYGVFRQAVVFPKGLYQSTEKEIIFWLRHELVHIRHHDNLKKVIAHGVLCLHWFNPFVWLMYFLFNRDMELLCDETVVRAKQESRKDYALALLSMAQQKSMGFQTGLGFGRNAVTERITAVMKFKGLTVKGILGAVLAVIVALTIFGSHYVSYAADGGNTVEHLNTANVAEYTVTMDTETAENIAEDDGPLVFGFASSNAYVTGDGQMESAQPGAADVTEEITYWTVEADTVATADSTTKVGSKDYVKGAEETAEDTEYTGDVAEVAEGTDSAAQVGRSIESIIDEYREFGLSIQVTDNDYQLYYKNEPVYFFADNTVPEEKGFSGRLFLSEPNEKNGKTGVITQYDSNGKISGLRHLSEKESEAYTRRWR